MDGQEIPDVWQETWGKCSSHGLGLATDSLLENAQDARTGS